MLRRSLPCRVVFTQGFPFLADFAARNFLPGHPLSKSPMWLDENDFSTMQAIAERRGVPAPLRINAVNHHPTLSPYAAKPKKAARKTEKARTGSSISSKEASPALTLSERTASFDPVLPTNSNSSSSSVNASTSSLPPSAVDQRYSAPICQIEQYRHLHMYNLDQMMVDDNSPLAQDSGMLVTPDSNINIITKQSNSDAGGVAERDEIRRMANSGGGGGGFNAAGQQQQYSLTQRMQQTAQGLSLRPGTPPLYDPSVADTASASGGGDGSGYYSYGDGATEEGCARALQRQENVKQLRSRFPNPGHISPLSTFTAFSSTPGAAAGFRNGGGGGGGPVMLSIKSGRPYHPNMQPELLRLRGFHGYVSQYWGTVAQWKKIGARLQPSEKPHIVYIPIKTKLVHISLIENAEEALQRCYVSAKTGALSFIYDIQPDAISRMLEVQQQHHHHHHHGLAFHSGGGEGRFNRESEHGLFQHAIIADMRIHRYQSPVYFSGLQLLSLRLAVRPGTHGIDIRALQSSAAFSHRGYLQQGLPPAIEELSADRGGQQSAGRFGNPHGGLGGSGAAVVRHYYHMSQVHFPAGFTVPLAVVSAELEANPGVAMHGVSGRVLLFSELTVENVMNAYPEVGAVVSSQPRMPPEVRAAMGIANDDDKDSSSNVNGDGEATPVGVEEEGEEAAGDGADSDDRKEDDDGDDFLAALEKEITTSAPATGTITTTNTTVLVPTSPHAEADRKQRMLALPDEAFASLIRMRVDPANSHGRSLWFLAEDVLQLDGIVDVNATPVEVRDASGSAGGLSGDGNTEGGGLDTAGGGATISTRAMYNIECLLNPDEGLAIINQRIPGTGGIA